MNINYTTENCLCLGCGVCEDVCPKKCIQIKRIKGEYRPRVDEDLCLGEKCSRCLKVCPGIGMNLYSEANEIFIDSELKQDKHIGKYVSLHIGYSLDYDIRYRSASGGLVSQFLIFLLEKHIIDGAVVTGFGSDHITPKSYIAKTREEIIAARSSKYCPVSLNQMGNEITNLDGKYVIVGLPCHIQGFRKRLKIDKTLRDRVVGLFSIYCSSNRTFYSQDYLFKHYGVRKNKIRYFSYRDYGCLGNLTIETKNENRCSPLVCTNSFNTQRIQIPYSQYYVPVLRSFFKPHRCLTCIDHYGLLADMCFGDIHIKPYSEDHIGISSCIIRSKYWERLFIMAANDGYIYKDDIDAEILNKSQATMLYPKQRRAKAVMNMDRMLRRRVPDYGQELESPRLGDYVKEIICHVQRFIGNHRRIWLLIDMLNNIKNK